MKDSKIRLLVLSSMFAALCCVATMTIRVPTFGTNGYVNIGDTVVLLAAWLIGGVNGALAAGIGSGMSDLLSGYTHYVPGTFVIKFLVALIAYSVYRVLSEKRAPKVLSYAAGAVAAETVMIFGYFTYQFTILGYGIAAASSIPGNCVQGITCSVLALAVIGALNAAKVTQKLAVVR